MGFDYDKVKVIFDLRYTRFNSSLWHEIYDTLNHTRLDFENLEVELKGCKHCSDKFEQFGEDNELQIRQYGEKYYLKHGKGYYDEYDSYDIESEIEFCPKCGNKLS